MVIAINIIIPYAANVPDTLLANTPESISDVYTTKEIVPSLMPCYLGITGGMLQRVLDISQGSPLAHH